MSKTIIKASSVQLVIHSSDGKDAALASYAGITPVVDTISSGKVSAAHGQVAGTTVVFNSPA